MKKLLLSVSLDHLEKLMGFNKKAKIACVQQQGEALKFHING